MFSKYLFLGMKSAISVFHWLRHYIISDTLHGTHSPFVYKFLETIIYNTSQLYDERNSLDQLNKKHKYLKLIYRISKFYPHNKVLIINSDGAANSLFSEEKVIENDLSNTNEYFEIIYFGEALNEDELKFYYHQYKSNTNETSFFVFPSIRKNQKYFKTWKELCLDETNVISIDFFDLGLLFFNQKKPKEHFNIYY